MRGKEKKKTREGKIFQPSPALLSLTISPPLSQSTSRRELLVSAGVIAAVAAGFNSALVKEEEAVDRRDFYGYEGEEGPPPGSRGPGPSSSSTTSAAAAPPAGGAIADADAAARLAPYVTVVDGRLYVRTRTGAALRLDPAPGGDPRRLLLTGAGGVRFTLTLSRRVEGDVVAAWRKAFASPDWEDALEPV